MLKKYLIKKRIAILMVLIIVVGIIGCTNKNEEKFQAEFIDLFDTQIILSGYAKNKNEFEKKVELYHDELEELYKLYDIYNNYEGIANLKDINDNAGIKPIKVDEKIISMLEIGIEMEKLTKGELNIAFGSVLNIWHDYRVNAVDNGVLDLPDIEVLREANKHTNINDIIINKEKSTVFLQDSKMRLDVGGVAKGHAIEKIAQFIEAQGETSFLISVGGDIRAIGKKPNGDKWSLGIRSPEENESIVKVLVSDMSLVTSGDYQRYYTVNGKKYSHIINKETLYPSESYRSVSILSKDAGFADAISTAVFNLPLEKGEELINSLTNTEAMWIDKDDNIFYSEGFKKYIK